MRRNVHPVERWIRVIAGLFVASLAFWGPANPWFLLGLIPAATGVMGWCGAYALFGFSTCRVQGGGPKPA